MALPAINPYQVVAAVAANGDATATLAAVTYPMLLTGLTVTGAQGSKAVVYLGYIAPSAVIDRTDKGWDNTADYPNPRRIPPGQNVIVVWPGGGSNPSAYSATFIVSTDS